ncbi:enolase C-terminal domain-like protein [Picrophilus oshimae]|uniref:L-alanine-DL-glutamate epimerase n=1 Tax=Picrophilus torridus (strain ATCC 700027 / DSM 9790 / JCM 10055 / NBRC 100828 / KAW 2/3) TaxID=1122961 RepID=A0A8G2FXS8_PICTO|nr:enolase C-terminal domain-like protein [Picrophilus oshimae]SMD31462.1 L-alanine-DL-glutamate epimerase [Picrophilus oshimae DSM 9789]
MSKIKSLERIHDENVSQQIFPYTKPTDYYKDIIGEISPAEAAMITKIVFLKLKTESGVESYISVTEPTYNYIEQIKKYITMFDVSEISKAWDFFYRTTLPTGRTGLALHAISAINLLMYDAFGKEVKKPVYDLIGGRTRKSIRAYASHLHPDKIENLQKEAEEYLNNGYKDMKMRFIASPADVYAIDKNIELVKAVRDVIGYSINLAGDFWMSLNYNFAYKMLKALEKYELAWIEEPLLPDDFNGYKNLVKKVNISISAGEHHYHVYDFKRLLDCGVMILQPDATWVGGITPMKKIAGLAEAYGAQVIPHAGNIYNLHFIISEPEAVTPISEYLTRYRDWMEQHIVNVPRPVRAHFELNDSPGFGIKYDLE